MLKIGQLRATCCDGWTRREWLRAGGLSLLGVSLADLLHGESAQAAQRTPPARSVILLWLWGGPSHLDTFDLKPKAPSEYRGPYAPIATRAPGVEICELLPQLAERAPRYALLRSLQHTSNDHGVAGTIGLTGSNAGAASLSGQVLPGDVKPAHGAIVSRVLGFDPVTPRFVTMGGNLHQGKRRITGEGGGTAGGLHDPFRLDYDVEHGVKIPQLDLIEGQSRERLTSQRELQIAMNRLADQIQNSPNVERFDQFYRQALALLTTSQARQVYDLDQEPEVLRQRYGKFRFGQCCLLARRLIEAGVRFVQVNWSSHVESVEDTGDGGWDMHDRYFQVFQDRHSWMLDQSLSALLDDLHDRGLLDETIVVAVGEFGRTPKINGKAGRDHWNDCYAGLIAGGGIQGGRVIGSSDRRGEYPASDPISPANLFATVFHQMGITTTTLTGAGLTPQGAVIEDLL
jgi:hypothetical protein